MAFGISPYYLHTYSLEGIDKKHFLFIALKAAYQLDWEINNANDKGFNAYTSDSIFSGSQVITVTLEDQTASIKSECLDGRHHESGKNEINIVEFIQKLEYLKDKYANDDIETQYDELLKKYPLQPIENDGMLPPPPKEKITSFLSTFIPVDGYYIAPILLIINVLIFIMMILAGVHILTPEGQSLINWGANFRPVTLNGQGWRLFTSCFIHIGILHLLMNMYALSYIGILLEPYLGKTRFLAAYIITGVAASLASLCWHDLTISAGASGAIFGMYGVFLALLTTNLLDKSVKKAFLTSILLFVGYNLLYGLKPNSGIDNAAHIGGLMSGVLIGYAMLPSLKKPENKTIQYSILSGLSVLLIISSVTIFHNLPNDIGKYEKEMQNFTVIETKALEVFQLPEGTSNEKILATIKDKGLPLWNENIRLLDSLKSYDLPLPIRTRNGQLRKYCELRIKSYELIYKSIEENTSVYDMEINECNQQIDALIIQLAGN